MNNDLEKYLPNYDIWLNQNKSNKLTITQTKYLFIGLEPEFAEKYEEICNKYLLSETSQELWPKEERLFYEEYIKISPYWFNWLDNDEVTNKWAISNNFIDFANAIYNIGYVPCNQLSDYLKKINKPLKYQNTSKIYFLFDEYRDKPRWSLEELRCLVNGIDPNSGQNDLKDKTELITFCNGQFNNRCYITNQDKDGNQISVHLKNGTIIFDFAEYLKGYEIKNENGYEAKKLLEITINKTKVKPPEVLVEMILGVKPKLKTKTSPVSQKLKNDFVDYLLSEIRKYPFKKPMPKKSDKNEANYYNIAKNHGITSERMFNELWKSALKKAKENNWSQSGRPPSK